MSWWGNTTAPLPLLRVRYCGDFPRFSRVPSEPVVLYTVVETNALPAAHRRPFRFRRLREICRSQASPEVGSPAAVAALGVRRYQVFNI